MNDIRRESLEKSLCLAAINYFKAQLDSYVARGMLPVPKVELDPVKKGSRQTGSCSFTERDSFADLMLNADFVLNPPLPGVPERWYCTSD